MEPILLTYQSKTGFTKKYVEWIAETLNCHRIPSDQINTVDMNLYKTIVYGAGIHAGRIRGLNEFKKKINTLNGKEIIVFATGGAPYTEKVMASVKMNNFTKEESDIAFFYFQSGLNYEKMGLGEKAMLKMYSQILKMKAKKSDSERRTSKAMAESYDYCNRENIKPLIDYIGTIKRGDSSECCDNRG